MVISKTLLLLLVLGIVDSYQGRALAKLLSGLRWRFDRGEGGEE